MEVTQRVFQRQFVTVRAQSRHHADRKVGQIRVMAEGFACVDIGKMHFDKRNGDRSQRIADRHAGMGIRSGIDHDEVDMIATGLMDAFDQRPFVVVLKGFDERTGGISATHQRAIDIVERGESVMLGFAGTQKIQIGAVHNQDMRVQTGSRFGRDAAGSFSRHVCKFAVDRGELSRY